MIRNTSSDKPSSIHEKEELILPSFSEGLEVAMNSGKSFQIEGTNVVRVPFGIRHPQKKRPERPQRWATLVLPFQPLGSPTPPPQAA
ncbi:hypothetical protein [Prochlorococcus sp. MIT 1307]|uniref:hypothetical protein n=1 Tax=Prochlorococcus sp. MIT 1307 TaxID=3096219 RepID=UPI002A74F70D|nr:hypothetical protein [Prochlorococcus sp. MIT 1307]